MWVSNIDICTRKGHICPTFVQGQALFSAYKPNSGNGPVIKDLKRSTYISDKEDEPK